MPDISKILRTRPSKRAIVAVAGVAAMGFGIANSVGTQAATQDAVSAKVSQIGTQNFYPVWGPNSVDWDSPSGGGCFPTSTNIRWGKNANAPANQKYVLQEWGNQGTTLLWTSTPSTNMAYNGWSNSSGGGSTHEVRVFGVNATTGEWSTSFMSFFIYGKNSCGKWLVTDWQNVTNESDWQRTTTFNPAAPSTQVASRGTRVMVQEAPSTTSTSSTTNSAPSTSASSSSTSQPTTSSSTTTPSTGTTTAPKTTAPATSAPTTTTTTVPTTTATTPSTTASSTTTSTSAN